MEQATARQTASIWKWVIRHQSSLGAWSNADSWSNLARSGKLSKEGAWSIIRLMTSGHAARAAEEIREYYPEFNIIDSGPAETPETETPETETPETKTPETETPDVLERLAGILNPKLMADVESYIKDLEERATVQPGAFPTANPKSADYIKPAWFDKVHAYLKMGKNVALIGPQGLGKSRAGQELAKALGLNFFLLSFSGGLQYHHVIGSKELHDGSSSWQPSPMLKAIQEPSLIMLDEGFRCDPETSTALNSLLERNQRHIMTPIGLIKCHPETRFLLTDNTNGRTVSRQYTAAQPADGSYVGRWLMIEADYDTEVESGILKNIGLPSPGRDWLLDRITLIRRNLKKAQIDFDCAGTRQVISIAECLLAGLDKAECFRDHITGALSKAEGVKALEGVEL